MYRVIVNLGWGNKFIVSCVTLQKAFEFISGCYSIEDLTSVEVVDSKGVRVYTEHYTDKLFDLVPSG